jgi:hypothetical protein
MGSENGGFTTDKLGHPIIESPLKQAISLGKVTNRLALIDPTHA